MKKFILLTLFTILFLAVSCPHRDPALKPTQPEVLPPATQTGANTCGFLLNGKVWLPGGGGVAAIVSQYYHGKFGIGSHKGIKNSVDQYITWTIKPIYDTGKYLIKANYPEIDANFIDNINHSYSINISDSMMNWVHITKLDSSKRIISGTFNLFFAEKGFDTLRITQGRFDTIYEF